MASPALDALIDALQLEPHVEGGYFRRTFQADHRAPIPTAGGERWTMTSIYYLLTHDRPIGRWHRNASDILHCFHLGGPIEYSMLHPDGTLETAVMGPDPTQGQQLQLVVRGGVWKASALRDRSAEAYGLISEAVAPGFDYADMTLADRDELLAAFPQHRALILALT